MLHSMILTSYNKLNDKEICGFLLKNYLFIKFNVKRFIVIYKQHTVSLYSIAQHIHFYLCRFCLLTIVNTTRYIDLNCSFKFKFEIPTSY